MTDQRHNILLACASPEDSTYIQSVLTLNGYNVIIAATGKECFLKAESHIDLILVERRMPDIDGLKLCHKLKTEKTTRHIPVIILGPDSDNIDMTASFHFGVDDYLRRPFDDEEMVARVEAALLRHHVAERISEEAQFEMLDELHRIVDNQNIVPFFQPIYQLTPFKLYGFEVLSRPQSNGIFSNPESLFKAAMRFGCYYELEMIVWRKALNVAQKKFGTEHLFLNCNPYLIESRDARAIKEVFSGYDMDDRHVILEVTERSTINVFENFARQVDAYREQGFKIAVDDVGAGYSSLDVIVQTRPEVVKLDRHIMNGLSRDNFRISLVRLMVEFCIENGIICIAEGIETKEDCNTAMELGVNLGQGYYFRQPTSDLNMKMLRGAVLPS